MKKLNNIVLRPGSTGPHVVQLQDMLGLLGYARGPSDGVFGQETAEALRIFQTDWGLVANAVVGEDTREALNDALGEDNDLFEDKP